MAAAVHAVGHPDAAARLADLVGEILGQFAMPLSPREGDRGWRDRARALLPAALSPLHRAGWRESARAGQESRRADRVGLEHAVAGGAVLD